MSDQPPLFPENESEGPAGPDHVEDMYRNWFLEYASYVILDRAVPEVDDGLKPVQRRILHALHELEDGRYNKAANVIGHTMRYHPHGDAAIGDALVKLAQKSLLIDTQGNWGNTLTGDRAAASRYIECRLSGFGKDVLFNDELTEWSPSYDGRNKEPVSLPVKFPLLLAMGVEGIAVGLSTRVLPHNFNELIAASIAILRGKKKAVLPDFESAGLADFTAYNDGKRGGKVRVRARIHRQDGKSLRISEVPYGVTTTGLIESILAANDKGKLRIKRVEDNTAGEVDILVELPPGVSPEQTIEALYAFTDCEVSISPNCCIIRNSRPCFIGVSELLEQSTRQTTEYLRRELEISRDQLREKMHFAALEQIFIEKKIYRRIESAETWDEVLSTIHRGLKTWSKDFLRPVSDDDVQALTEIKIKRISKYDSRKAGEALVKLKNALAEVEFNLENLIDYAVAWFKDLKRRYGKGRERRTEVTEFGVVKASAVAVANLKLYVNRKEGFVGTSLKKEEFLTDCSSLDEVIVFRRDGRFMVSKVSAKVFMGKGIQHIALFKRGDDRRIYHMVYQDGRGGAVIGKRFNVTSITRDKEYDLTRGSPASRVLYFSENPNGEREQICLHLKPQPRVRTKKVPVNFGTMDVKSRTVNGQILTKHPVREVEVLERGASTLLARPLWFDDKTGRVNSEEKGRWLGEFKGSEKMLVVYRDGAMEVNDVDPGAYYGDQVLEIRRYESGQVVSVIYFEAGRQQIYVKRFALTDDLCGKRQNFIGGDPGSEILILTLQPTPLVKISFKKGKKGVPPPQLLRLAEFIGLKGIKATGNRLSKETVKKVVLL